MSIDYRMIFITIRFSLLRICPALPSALTTVGFSKPQIADLANLSHWAFLPTLAGVGLRTHLREMTKQGIRPFLVGAIGEFAIPGVTLAMVITLARFCVLIGRGRVNAMCMLKRVNGGLS